VTGPFLRIARQATIAALFVAAAVLGIISGVLFAYVGDLPQISALDDYAPSTITRLYAAGGEVIGEFATERRVIVRYDDIPPVLRNAILASEDANFDKHVGLSVPRIIVTAVKDVIYRKRAGASTLTQQLARHLFLSEYMRAGRFEQTGREAFERKAKEAIVTIQIEKRYTKPEIFTMYCNQMYFGHGAYGVEAASRLYFAKPIKALELEEAALIAGILQGNVRQSPYVNMEAALRRRNYVLERMAQEGFITRDRAEAGKRKPIVVRGQPDGQRSIAPFFAEEVRKQLEAKYGARRLYEAGLSVQTTLDAKLQEAANRAIDSGLRQIDKRRGFRRPKRNIVKEGHRIDAFREPRWERGIAAGDIVPAVVTGSDGGRIQIRVGRYRGEIPREGFAWTRRATAAQVAAAGDLIEVRAVKIDEAAATLTASLEQTPEIEGALLAIDNRTGQIRAMVGGLSFDRSKFNRATQAYRQVGSAFKPFVYTTAIDRGYTPASIVMDAPASFSGGAGQPAYAPQNYDHEFHGAITLRRALEQSRNIPAVRMMDALGPRQVVAYARRFGLESPMQPYLSLALGAAEATLLEITRGYAVFPNQGVLMKPYGVVRVSDRDGSLLEENRPEPRDAIRADTAYVMTNLLRGVVLRGTAAKAASLDWPLAGKTGTTNDYTDAWFVGFDPDITVGVWVGYDLKKSLGPRETGTQAALPIWMDFMKAWIGNRKDAPEFAPPGNIVFVAVDRNTGGAAEPSEAAINEAFIAGTQPGGTLR